ncbi:hypothetical protein F4861DRAFT_535618 [Xylaria intraflava]|nr:hypothetical protein F4861DRAFT_535618 [Xylaria intraflava]
MSSRPPRRRRRLERAVQFVPRPLSPWAQRFGYNRQGREPILDDFEIHSNLAPIWPRMHPLYYSNPPNDNSRPVTMRDIDTVFATEASQEQTLQGLRSWEVGPLMQHVRFSNQSGLIPGGHQTAGDGAFDNAANEKARRDALKVFHAERIQVDESTWFKFLRKDRWLNTVGLKYASREDWSVDIPKIWEVLSIILELANRIFRALVAEKHTILETVLYGLFADWDQIVQDPAPMPAPKFLLSRQFVAAVNARETPNDPSPLDFVANFTPQDWENRLEDLLQTHGWSFVDKFKTDTEIWGVNIDRINCTLLDIAPLKRLMGNQITLAERCFLFYVGATTVVHELFHAIWATRRMGQSRLPPGFPRIDWTRRAGDLDDEEPMVDYEGDWEIGFAAETRIFGGVLQLGPSRVDDLPLGAFSADWPRPYNQPSALEGYYHPAFDPQKGLRHTRVTSLHVSKMLSAAFWDDPAIPNKTANYFHHNQIFINNTIWGGRARFRYNLVTLADTNGMNLLPGEQEMIDTWNDTHYTVSRRRAAWGYERHRDTWADSAWNLIGDRRDILSFARAFLRRDAVECRALSDTMVHSVSWTSDRDVYTRDIPPLSREEPYRWLYHALGLLMFAAMPIFEDPVDDSREIMIEYRFEPSRTCTLPAQRTEFTLTVKENRKAPESRMFDPLKRPNVKPINDFDQDDYLDLVTSLVDYMGQQHVLVETTWLNEILRMVDNLRRKRADIKRQYGNVLAKERWVSSWDFEMPEYNQTFSRYWAGRWAVLR